MVAGYGLQPRIETDTASKDLKERISARIVLRGNSPMGQYQKACRCCIAVMSAAAAMLKSTYSPIPWK